MKNDLNRDFLCLLSPHRLSSSQPYSNISEYCLRDGDAVPRYLCSRGCEQNIDNMSDFELFEAIMNLLRSDSESFVSTRIRKSIDRLCGGGTSDMPTEDLWTLSAGILDEKSTENIFSFRLDRLGMPLLPGQNKSILPTFVSETVVDGVFCPFGTAGFDLEPSKNKMTYRGFSSETGGLNFSAVFCKGFEFEEPNEYEAERSFEKFASGSKLNDRERRILSSQLLRKMILHHAEEGKEMLLFLPAAPDVYSMGEIARLLDYADGAIKKGRLKITVFAPDAVGLCFANGIAASKYKKIAADTGVCGNGCGCAETEDASYWGAETLNIRRASLSATPAFIGK